MIDLTPTTTVAELMADGQTHLEVRCRCGRQTEMPFQLYRWPSETTLADLAARLRCARCGALPASLKGTTIGGPGQAGPLGNWHHIEKPERKALRFLGGEPLEEMPSD